MASGEPRCFDCGQPPRPGEQLSRNALCPSCSEDRHREQVRQMHAFDGPHFDAWLHAAPRRTRAAA